MAFGIYGDGRTDVLGEYNAVFTPKDKENYDWSKGSRSRQERNTVKYIKMIRDYDKTISIGDIKRKIDGGDYVIEFDPFGYSLDDEIVKHISEKQYIKRFYKLIQDPKKAGAVITVFDEDGENGDILFLKRELDMCLGIIAKTNRYPDGHGVFISHAL